MSDATRRFFIFGFYQNVVFINSKSLLCALSLICWFVLKHEKQPVTGSVSGAAGVPGV